MALNVELPAKARIQFMSAIYLQCCSLLRVFSQRRGSNAAVTFCADEKDDPFAVLQWGRGSNAAVTAMLGIPLKACRSLVRSEHG